MDSESCVNAVSCRMIEEVEWKAEPHPHPYKVSWINSTALDMKQRCLILIEFDVYKDKIWCDVVTMYVGQIILGRSWLYDNDVIIHGRSNMYQFEHVGKEIKLILYQSITKKPKLNAPKKSKGVNLISVTEFDQELKNDAPCMILTAREVVWMLASIILSEVTPMIEEFSDIFPEDLPNKLPPIHDIQHAIDLVLG